MMMKNKMIRALGLSAVAVGLNIGVANAGEVTGTAQVTVLSTINMVESSALDFGTIAAFFDATSTSDNVAILTMPADATGSAVTYAGTIGTNAEANIVVIVEGSPGQFDVTGAAPDTTLTLTIATASSVFSDPSGASTNRFVLAASGYYMTLNGTGDTFTTSTDAAGAMSFNVGGSITTAATGAATTAKLEPYTDATYTGAYEVTVSY